MCIYLQCHHTRTPLVLTVRIPSARSAQPCVSFTLSCVSVCFRNTHTTRPCDLRRHDYCAARSPVNHWPAPATRRRRRRRGSNSPQQSVYRQFHSTETAVIAVVRAVDEKHVSLLLLLDLSAAFDTVDHSILLSIIEHRFCIRCLALDWFKSYFSDRTQTFMHADQTTCSFPVNISVPQGGYIPQFRHPLFRHPLSLTLTLALALTLTLLYQ